jgi:tRNA pseudouridine(55) synthase
MNKLEKVLKLDKKVGETPLECLERFRSDNPEYAKEKLTYAGRLDPLASGVLLVLVGEECKKKEKYLNLDKEYELTILFGFSTDSMDLLGMIEEQKNGALNALGNYQKKDFVDLLNKFEKTFKQKYPRFSSKTVNGKPLFEIAKEEGILDEDIPEKEVKIKKIEFQSFGFVSKKYIRDFALESIFKVKGNFRQNMCWAKWEKTLENFSDQNLPTLTIKVFCTSGTYMRSLAKAIGVEIGFPALALKIKRTMICL